MGARNRSYDRKRARCKSSLRRGNSFWHTHRRRLPSLGREPCRSASFELSGGDGCARLLLQSHVGGIESAWVTNARRSALDGADSFQVDSAVDRSCAAYFVRRRVGIPEKATVPSCLELLNIPNSDRTSQRRVPVALRGL